MPPVWRRVQPGVQRYREDSRDAARRPAPGIVLAAPMTPPTERPARTAQPVAALAGIGIAGIAVNAAALAAAPLLRPEISVVHGALSQYAIGPWSWLQNLGFVALGLGSMALACALALAGPMSRWLLATTLSLVVAGAASLGLAVFPMGEPSATTLLGDLHQTAGTIAVAFHMAAMLALLLACAADAGWRSLRAIGWLCWAVALAGALATQAELSFPHLPIPFGIVMRMVVAPVLFWWALVAIRLLRGPAR